MTEYSFYSGEFTEWTAFFIYASDIFLILALVFWLISILRSKNYQFKNIVFPPFVIPAKLVLDSDRGAGIQDLTQKVSFKNIILAVFQNLLHNKNTLSAFLKNKWLFLFLFLIWLVLNLAINKEYFEISAFQVAKFIELSLLMIFVYFNLQNSKVLINSLFILAFSGFLQSVIAIYQFIAQHSAFSSPILAKITGESIIGPQIPGVAKILVDGDKIIRAYGTFPHPNVLGGFLVFTILITIYLYLEHKGDTLSSTKPNLITGNSNVFIKEPLKNSVFVIPAKAGIHDLTQRMNFKSIISAVFQTILKIKQYLRILFSDAPYVNIIKPNSFYNTKDAESQVYITSLFWTFFIFIQLAGLFFTFSRSAWLGFLLSLFIISIFYFCNHKIVSRETISDKTTKELQKNGAFVISAKTEILNLYKNTIKVFFKFINVSRETIFSIFVFSAKAGIYCYHRLKLLLQPLIPSLHKPYFEDYDKKTPNSLKLFSKKLTHEKSRETLNMASEQGIAHKNTLFNKLLTVFQHNFYIKPIIRYKELFIALMIIIFVIGINLPLVSSRLDIDLYNGNSASDNSAINERIFYNNVSRETISNNLIFGSGVGTSIFKIDNYIKSSNISQKLQPWQYQPEHNIYFLIASEIGIIGLVLFLLFIVSVIYNSLLRNFNNPAKSKRHFIMSFTKKFLSVLQRLKLLMIGKNNILSIYRTDKRKALLENDSSLNEGRLVEGYIVSRETILKDCASSDKGRLGEIYNVSRETFNSNLNTYLIAILIAFIFIGLFDHYFWTLQQGRLMFWLVLGFILVLSDRKE